MKRFLPVLACAAALGFVALCVIPGGLQFVDGSKTTAVLPAPELHEQNVITLRPDQVDAVEAHRRSSHIGIGVATVKVKLVDTGVLVKVVEAASTAEDAGLKPGDLITAIDNAPIKDWTLSQTADALSGPMDTTVALSVTRDGKPLSITVKRDLDEKLGVTIEVPAGASREVYEVGYIDEKGPAFQAGVRQHDAITAINGADLANALSDEVKQVLGEGRPGSLLTISTLRRGAHQDVALHREFILDWSKAIEMEGQGSSQSGYYRFAMHNLDYVDLVKFTDDFMDDLGKWSLILDLRGARGYNPDIAAQVAARFVDSGVVLRYQTLVDGKRVEVVYEMKDGKLVKTGFDGGLPEGEIALPHDFKRIDSTIVVLVDGGTAGTAEALARTLQVSGRAKVVGVSSEGRAAVMKFETTGTGDQAVTRIVNDRVLLANDGNAFAAVQPDVSVWSGNPMKIARGMLPGGEDEYFYTEVLPYRMAAGAAALAGLGILILFFVSRRKGKQAVEEKPAAQPEKPLTGRQKLLALLPVGLLALFVVAMFTGGNLLERAVNGAPEGTTTRMIVSAYVDGNDMSKRQAEAIEKLKTQYQGDITFEVVDVTKDPDALKKLNWDVSRFPVIYVRHVFYDKTGAEVSFNGSGRGNAQTAREIAKMIQWQLDNPRKFWPQVKVERIGPQSTTQP